MAKLTRRTLVQTSVGVATIGVLAGVVTVPHMSAAAASDDAAKQLSTLKNPGFMVAYVSNLAKGEIVMLVGEEQVTFRDPQLALQLVRAAQ